MFSFLLLTVLPLLSLSLTSSISLRGLFFLLFLAVDFFRTFLFGHSLFPSNHITTHFRRMHIHPM